MYRTTLNNAITVMRLEKPKQYNLRNICEKPEIDTIIYII